MRRASSPDPHLSARLPQPSGRHTVEYGVLHPILGRRRAVGLTRHGDGRV
ncbi:hypothetical protein NGA_0136900 [Nannochloropsis gaditana CCMP526]|nr:hypothetical protein NGA_0136900 [Nannochloropsis gaditana CCMP526]EKU21030.1 hypothetical protein NGA_0136900 [Nannochloropsis gaditana CCMP526]|eukprot:XP_005855325.1 hypothetical protein NGA_0136900 [Nannochloropsis gaditana CCMP526]